MNGFDDTYVDAAALLELSIYPSLHFAVDRPDADTSFSPGQPIPVRWSVSDYRGREIPRDYSASIYHEATLVAELGMNRRASIQPSRLPADFYRVGAVRALTLRVTGPESARGMWSIATLHLDIVGEPDDVTAWSWTPRATRVRWKQDSYVLSGTLRSTSDLRLSASLILRENGAAVREFAPQNVILPPRGSVTVVFPAIRQDYGWFNPLLLVAHTAMYEVGFGYEVIWTINDDYGNSYHRTSEPFGITVYVAPEKRWALIAALSARVIAVTLAASAAVIAFVPVAGQITAGGLIAAAAAAAAASAAAQAAALDPPEPDPNFLHAVKIELPVISTLQYPPRTTANTKQADAADTLPIPAMLDIIGRARRILATHAALSQTQGRLLGARLVLSTPGMELQTDTSHELIGTMMDDVTATLESAKKLHGELSRVEELSPQTVGRGLQLLQEDETQQALRRLWADGGFAAPAFEELLKFVPQAMGKQLSIPLGSSANALAIHISRFAGHVRDDGIAFLATKGQA